MSGARKHETTMDNGMKGGKGSIRSYLGDMAREEHGMENIVMFEGASGKKT